MAYNIGIQESSYVCGLLNRSPVYFVTNGPCVGYLHTDGVWRNSTLSERGKYTGYFLTEEDANRAVLKDIAKSLTIDEEKAWLVLNAIYRINGNQLGAALDYAIPMMAK